MESNLLFYIAVILFCGLAFGRLVKQIKLPNVTGYLLAGLVIGPFLLKLLPAPAVESMSVVSDMALGFIAFSVGGEFKMSYFKRVGFTPIVIAVTEALGAVAVVFLGLALTGHDLAFSIVLASIAAATAPAATIMVIKQYKAKGPVTETLLSVVALDDAVALIGFGFAVTTAKVIEHVTGTSVLLSVLDPFIEVGLALLVGAALGAVFAVPLRWFKKDSNRLCLIIAFVFMGSALAEWMNVSALLLCMAMSAVFVNVYRSSENVMRIVDTVTPPLYMMFFVVSGAELDITVIPTIGLVGVVYVLCRVVGKMLGSTLGAVLMKAPAPVKRYLGPTLIPQAGVAIGLSLIAESVVPQYAQVIRAVVLCATFIYEIIGPAVTKISLQKAGEITAA
ncbi:MAG: cation:proton antiporter [Oscillospiraceae bacterium]|nr:cation:proton antiporter [Oscillospiraceae bacterium]